jgi:hypothetical protein
MADLAESMPAAHVPLRRQHLPPGQKVARLKEGRGADEPV